MPAVNANDPWLPADPVPLTRAGVPVSVCRITGTYPSLSLEAMNSVRCVSIEEREGAVPAAALFRYAFDGVEPASPQTVEQALSTAFTGAKAVNPGDRIGVYATRVDGVVNWIFYGTAINFGGDVDPKMERAHFGCVSVAAHCWDQPIEGARCRNSDAPETVSDLQTDLIAQFNPGGVPNASPSTADSGASPYTYPVFLDPNKTGTDGAGKEYPRLFDLPMAVAYLLYKYNAAQTWVSHQTRTALALLLVGREPIAGTPFDPADSTTYTSKPIQATDAPLNDRAWPGVVHDLVKDHGFGFNFPVATDGSNLPTTALNLWLKQGGTVKVLYLPSRANALSTASSPSTCNVGAAALGRDLAGVVNQWTVRGGLVQWEASFVLAPAFPSQTSDASSDSNLVNFDDDGPSFVSTYFNAYRTWTLDEGGDGHYLANSTSKVSTATSLDAVLGAPSMGVPQYLKRRRAPLGRLVTTDPLTGQPLKPRLAISTAYAGSYPAVWDGTATDWQPIDGGWELLKDRIGIRITEHNPNMWKIGPSAAPAPPFPDGVVKGVEKLVGGSPYYLRLTCVFEADVSLYSTAPPIATAALSYTVERVVDARDRLFQKRVYGKSEFNPTAGTNESPRDDAELAKAEAIAARTQSDSGVFESEVTIPRFTNYYKIGDRISQLSGRGLSFRTDLGGTGFAPVYPIVVGRTFELDGRQLTRLHLSDSGLDRRQYGRKRGDLAPAGASSTRQVPRADRVGLA